MQACCTYYHQGADLSEDLEPFLKSTAEEVSVIWIVKSGNIRTITLREMSFVALARKRLNNIVTHENKQLCIVYVFCKYCN